MVTGCELKTTTVSVVIGSSDGSENQTFNITDIPITTFEIWVNEVNALSDVEITRLSSMSELEVESIQDNQGNTSEFWVKWQEINNLLMSSASDRHYEVDDDSGTILFGDGVYGRRPPTGKGNIKAGYSLIGGKIGD